MVGGVYTDPNQLGDEVYQASLLNPVLPTMNDNAMAARMKALQYQGLGAKMPGLDTAPVSNWSEGLLGGIGNGVTLYGAQRERKANQALSQGFLDYANQAQHAADAKAQAEHDHTLMVANSLAANPKYGPAVANAYLQDPSLGNAYVGRVLNPVANQQGLQGALDARTHYENNHGVSDASFRTNTPDPVALNMRKDLGGSGLTYQDTNAKNLSNQAAAEKLTQDKRQGQAQPALLDAEVRTKQAGAVLEGIKAKFAPVMAQLEQDAKDVGNQKARFDLGQAQQLEQAANEFSGFIANGGVPTPEVLAKMELLSAGLTGKAPDLAGLIKTLQNPRAGQAVNAGKVFTGKTIPANKIVTLSDGTRYDMTDPRNPKPVTSKPKPQPSSPKPALLPDIGDKGNYARDAQAKREKAKVVTPAGKAVVGFFQGLQSHYDSHGHWVKD